MDRLSPLDAAFLEIEDEDHNASLAIASVAVIDGPAPDQHELMAAIDARLPLIPRYRQKIRTIPFDLGPPVWVDDADFDVAHHFQRVAVPSPGDEAALCELVALLMSERLDRTRPLWDCWVIEGLAGGRWALLSKVHHCLADGVSATGLQTVLFNGTAPSAETTFTPSPEPSAPALLFGAARELLANPLEELVFAARGLLSPKKLARRIADTARGLTAMAGALVPVAPTSLSGPIGRQRGYAVAHVSLPDAQEIARFFHTKVNDVVLAAISGAFRELLLSRGEKPSADALRTLVPVSVREGDGKDDLNNQVSLMLPLLPVDIADPVVRLTTVSKRLTELKSSKEADAGVAVTTTAAHAPFAPIAWTVRAAAKLPQQNVVTVATNVPGPRDKLSVLGSEIVELYPYVPIALRLRTGIAVLSYRDRMSFGITTDLDHVRETGLLAETIEREIKTLAGLAATKTTR
ncbi:wax ester/triacylglycerol synthase family O-acyltransferase [Amycolatopsis sp. NPDC059657]|uniref:WS/DGAT/MGAT family O-acyltransferase n=1 Tax=Amycolatopsis sp. NPDC059657 TaxID=3346899 RepID=UPI0036716508